MAESSAVKILISGDVNGKFSQLFRRVDAVNKKNGPFEMLLCVGNFFGSSDEEWKKCLNGTIEAPISTYILGPNNLSHCAYYSNMKEGELCANITYLGKKGLFTTCSGLKIAYISGTESDEEKDSEVHFTAEDISMLQMSIGDQLHFKGVDVLLTSQWTRGITNFSTKPNRYSEGIGSKMLSQLATVLKPRYHFCAMEGIHYERLPYRNHKVLSEAAKHVTRFIGLAKVGNPEKEKWLYAFNITPLVKMDFSELIKQPQDVTEFPYTFKELKDDKKQKPEINRFFFDTSDNEPQQRKRKSDKHFDKPKRVYKPSFSGPCWFCLGSPQVEKHLVTSIGTNIYLTIAKGALVDDHILILPVGHFQSTLELPTEVLDEIDQYKLALRKYYKTKRMDAVFFERNYKTQHLQIQVVPISSSIPSETIKECFLDNADSQNLQLDEIPRHSDLSQIIPAGCPYFFLELPNGQKFLHRIRGKFPLQFGREVLACPTLLNIPDRADWKACTGSKEEEAKSAHALLSITDDKKFIIFLTKFCSMAEVVSSFAFQDRD